MAQPGLLYLRVVSCHDLRRADLFTQNDIYVEVTFRGKKWKTSVVPDSTHPSWPDATRIFTFMVEDEAKHEVVEFTIKEKDVLRRDETLHHITFPLSELETDRLNHVRRDHLTFEACLGNFVFVPHAAVDRGAAVRLYTDCEPSDLVAV